MTTDVAVRQPTAALAIRPGQDFWTDKQRAALAVLGIKDASNGDLAVFMHYCQKTGLDPFSRQIYMICRREKQGDQWVAKQTIQVGIDGFRVIRDRIAQRLGVSIEYEDTIWYDADGTAHTVWLYDEPPVAARVVVVKDGKRFPGVVRTAAYMQRNRQGDPAGQWKTQPDHMIEKCAEAFALRRAFPHDLGGIYLEDEVPPMPADAQRPANGRVTAEEITQRRNGAPMDASPAGAPQEPPPVASPPTPPADPAGEAQHDEDDRQPARATGGQVGIIQKLWRDLGYDDADPDHKAERLAFTAKIAGLDELASTNDLTQDQAATVREFLKPRTDRADVIEHLFAGDAAGGGQDG